MISRRPARCLIDLLGRCWVDDDLRPAVRKSVSPLCQTVFSPVHFSRTPPGFLNLEEVLRSNPVAEPTKRRPLPRLRSAVGLFVISWFIGSCNYSSGWVLKFFRKSPAPEQVSFEVRMLQGNVSRSKYEGRHDEAVLRNSQSCFVPLRYDMNQSG